MKGKSIIVWREEWKRPMSLSIWSIIEKIKIANIVTGNKLLQYIDFEYKNKDGQRSPRNVNKLSIESRNRLMELTSIEITKIIAIPSMFE